MHKLGIVGCGNMAEAIATGILRSNLYLPSEILMSDISIERREKMNRTLGVDVTEDNDIVFREPEIVILAVKPQVFDLVLSRDRGSLLDGKILISIMAGITLEKMEGVTAKFCRIARVMPNTPALVQSGMSSVCYNDSVTDEDKEKIEEILRCMGEFRRIDEKLFSAATAVAGCSPAFVFMMIEAMADSAVSMGLTRDTAYHMAAAAIRGSADLYLDTREHPGKLKDMVCSPAGATIEGVKVLERDGFRFSLIDAMQACADRSVELGNKEEAHGK